MRALGVILAVLVLRVSANTNNRQAQQLQQSDCPNKVRELALANLNGTIYYFSNETQKMNWNDAEKFCKDYGMELASIETYAENLRIVTKLLSLRPTNYLDGTWTSGKRGANQQSAWSWSGTGQPLEYTAWFDNHPLLREDRDRLAIGGFRTKVRWISLPAADVRRFLCERQQPCQ